MYTDNQERRTIQVKPETHEKLKKRIKVYGETMDDIINRLMFEEGSKESKKTDTQKRIEKAL